MDSTNQATNFGAPIPPLGVNIRSNFPATKINIRTYGNRIKAPGLYDPNNLLSSRIKWDTANPPVGGVAVPRMPLQPAPLQPGSTVSEERAHDRSMKIYQDAYKAGEVFKEAILTCLGPEVTGRFAHPETGHMDQEIWEIMEHAEAICGVLTTGDIAVLKAKLKKWDFSKDFGTNASEYTKIFYILKQNNAEVAEGDKITIVQEVTKEDIAISDSLRQYFRSHPNQMDRTFDAMVLHVVGELPNITPFLAGAAAHIEAVALAAIVQQAPSAAAVQQQQQQQPGGSGRGGGRGGRGGGGRTDGRAGGRGRGRGATLVSGQPLYCFEHGANYSHNGQGCLVMKDDASYTDEMKNATHACILKDKHGQSWMGKA